MVEAAQIEKSGLPIETKPGTKVNGGRRQTLRKVNVTGVLLLPVFLYAFDGATTMYRRRRVDLARLLQPLLHHALAARLLGMDQRSLAELGSASRHARARTGKRGEPFRERTAESCLTLMLERALTRYLDGKGKSRAHGDACNARVRKDLKLRKLFSVNKERKLNPIGLKGEEVRILMEDLVKEDSKLIAAFKDLYKNLDIAPGTTGSCTRS